MKPNSFTEALAESHYTLLEIPTDFDGSNEGGDLLRRAFRQTSRRLHPDKPRGSEEMFQLAAAAHAVLLDAAERERYDKGYDMPHREEGIDHYAGGYGQASGKNGQLNQGNGFSIHHGSTLHWAWPRFQGFQPRMKFSAITTPSVMDCACSVIHLRINAAMKRGQQEVTPDPNQSKDGTLVLEAQVLADSEQAPHERQRAQCGG